MDNEIGRFRIKSFLVIIPGYYTETFEARWGMMSKDLPENPSTPGTPSPPTTDPNYSTQHYIQDSIRDIKRDILESLANKVRNTTLLWCAIATVVLSLFLGGLCFVGYTTITEIAAKGIIERIITEEKNTGSISKEVKKQIMESVEPQLQDMMEEVNATVSSQLKKLTDSIKNMEDKSTEINKKMATISTKVEGMEKRAEDTASTLLDVATKALKSNGQVDDHGSWTYYGQLTNNQKSFADRSFHITSTRNKYYPEINDKVALNIDKQYARLTPPMHDRRSGRSRLGVTTGVLVKGKDYVVREIATARDSEGNTEVWVRVSELN